MEYEKIAKKFRKKPILEMDASTVESVDYGVSDIEKLLPHRDPFLLIDKIEGVDFEQKGIVGSRFVDPADPVLKGHFPDYPILPGVLQVEMIGQLAICYYSFAKEKSTKILKDNSKLGVRALKIYHTLFQHEVLPNDNAKILAKVLDEDEYKFKGIGQVLNNGKVCTVAIAEFYIV